MADSRTRICKDCKKVCLGNQCRDCYLKKKGMRVNALMRQRKKGKKR